MFLSLDWKQCCYWTGLANEVTRLPDWVRGFIDSPEQKHWREGEKNVVEFLSLRHRSWSMVDSPTCLETNTSNYLSVCHIVCCSSGADLIFWIWFFFFICLRESLFVNLFFLCSVFFTPTFFFFCTFCTNLRSVMFSAKQLFLITANRPEIIIVFISLRRFIFTFSFVLLFIFQINISPRISERGSGQVLTGFHFCCYWPDARARARVLLLWL